MHCIHTYYRTYNTYRLVYDVFYIRMLLDPSMLVLKIPLEVIILESTSLYLKALSTRLIVVLYT